MIEVLLRDVFEDADLAIFFEQQRDPEANYMAAFTAKDPSDKVAFETHWARILDDDSIIKTILYQGQVAGPILFFEHLGEPEVSSWIGRDYWGRGIATRALS
ncbi:GNAT family N-acetyltransferase, partial [Yersinia pestis]|nr:GNAT family N-acetyltransferase [Yersinia pestis]